METLVEETPRRKNRPMKADAIAAAARGPRGWSELLLTPGRGGWDAGISLATARAALVELDLQGHPQVPALKRWLVANLGGLPGSTKSPRPGDVRTYRTRYVDGVGPAITLPVGWEPGDYAGAVVYEDPPGARIEVEHLGRHERRPHHPSGKAWKVRKRPVAAPFILFPIPESMEVDADEGERVLVEYMDGWIVITPAWWWEADTDPG